MWRHGHNPALLLRRPESEGGDHEKIENEKAAGGVETIAAAGDAQQLHSNAHPTPRKALPDDSAHSQRLRLLARLRVAPVDTITARRELVSDLNSPIVIADIFQK